MAGGRDRLETPLPIMFLLLSDVLSRLLPNDDPGIVDAEECFGCRGYVFTDLCQPMDLFSHSTVFLAIM
jgi:hypothetical protein